MRTVVWWGDEGHQRRWDRDENGLWLQHGWWVECFPARSEDPHKWSRIGECWGFKEHVVVPARWAGDRWKLGVWQKEAPGFGNVVVEP